MEGEVCQFDKFGFCKYQKDCKRRHFSEECKDLSRCKSIKTCVKRHPKACKQYASGHCRFESGCAYKHEEPIPNKEQIQMAQKVQKLEQVLHAMTRKVLAMEEEIKEIKKNNEPSKGVKGLRDQEKGDNVKEDMSDNNFKPKSYSSPKDKEPLTQPKCNKDKIKESEVKEDMFLCTKCDYKSKKEANLKKHIITKHEDHVCKECGKKLKSFMELLKHVASQHNKEPDEDIELQVAIQNEKEEEDIEKGKSKVDKSVV